MTATAKHTVVIRDTIAIAAPLQRLFALSTSVPLVQRTLGFRAVDGVTTGHVTMGSRVLWKGWLFGLPQRHLTLITAYEAPHVADDRTRRAFFQDTQESGRFRSFHHDHHMAETAQNGTVLSDEIHYSLPFGAAGYAVARYIMEPYIRRTLRSRFLLLERIAVSTDEWQAYI